MAKQALNSRSGRPIPLKDIAQYQQLEQKKDHEVMLVRITLMKTLQILVLIFLMIVNKSHANSHSNQLSRLTRGLKLFITFYILFKVRLENIKLKNRLKKREMQLKAKVQYLQFKNQLNFGLAKQTFQLARCECILRVTSQTSLFT